MKHISLDFTVNDYLSAALSREIDLLHLQSNLLSTVFSLYCSGLIVECILRAFIRKYTKEFNGRHNLEDLFVKSLLAEKLNSEEKEMITAEIKELNKIWYNNLRFCSEKRLRRVLAHEIAQRNYIPRDMNKYLLNYCGHIFNISKRILDIGIKWI